MALGTDAAQRAHFDLGNCAAAPRRFSQAPCQRRARPASSHSRRREIGQRVESWRPALARRRGQIVAREQGSRMAATWPNGRTTRSIDSSAISAPAFSIRIRQASRTDLGDCRRRRALKRTRRAIAVCTGGSVRRVDQVASMNSGEVAARSLDLADRPPKHGSRRRRLPLHAAPPQGAAHQRRSIVEQHDHRLRRRASSG